MEAIINKIQAINGSIVITTPSIKKKLVEYFSNKLLKITFKSFDEFKNDLFDFVDDEMLLQNLDDNKSLDILKIKLNNAMLITEDSDNPLVHELYELHLKNTRYNNFINSYVLDYYNANKVYLIDYDYSDDLVNKGLKLLNNIENIDVESKEYTHSIYHFNDFQDEIFYIVNEISKLLSNGVNPSNIVINKVNIDYEIKFREVFRLFEIDENFQNQIPLYDLEETKHFINNLFNSYSGKFNDAFSSLIKSYDSISQNIIQVINILNVLIYYDYNLEDKNLVKIMTYLLKNHNVKTPTIENAIRFENVFNNIYDENTYIFIPNFNQDVIPTISKDNEYLSDKIKKDLGFVSSNQKNKIKKRKIVNFIKRNKNVVLSSSKNSISRSYVRNVLLDSDELKNYIDEKKQEINLDSIKSAKPAYLRYLKAFDLYSSYHILTSDFEQGFNTFNEEVNKRYDNSFTGISSELLKPYLNPLILSYSSIDDYARCPFYFYAKNILKIVSKSETTKDNTSILIGIVFHFVLENLIKNTFLDNKEIVSLNDEIEKMINYYLDKNQIVVTSKLKFYLIKLIKPLSDIYDRITKHLENSNFKVFSVEQKFEMKLDETTILKGFIDKILKYNHYYIVIDYKTRSVDVNWNNLDKALDMQLPFYLMFIKNMDSNALIGGAYLQSVLKNTPYTYKDNKTYIKQFNESTTYIGYSNNDHDVIKAIDNFCVNEERILSPIPFNKSGGLSSYFDKVSLDNDSFNKIINYTKEKIELISREIKKGNFKVSPKKIDKNYYSCKNCPLFSLCYRTIKDVKFEKNNDDLSYILGGNLDEME